MHSKFREHIKNVDVFVALNTILFILKCMIKTYPGFIAKYGSEYLTEFFVYAVGIISLIFILWMVFREYSFGTTLLVFLELGILVHFFGTFVTIDGVRLYDSHILGIGYDKYVHFVNSFVCSMLIRRLFIIKRNTINHITSIFILLTVLGIGGIFEIVEYGVVLTIPHNGVGGYDNNMQDLIANLCGGLFFMAVCGQQGFLSGHSVQFGRNSGIVTDLARDAESYRLEQDSIMKTRIKAALEIVTVFSGIFLFTWTLFSPDSLYLVVRYRGAIISLFAFTLLYLTYISPCLIFKDTLADRGLGTWNELFIRTDNLKTALLGYGTITLIGAVVIVGGTFLFRPDYIAHINWTAFILKLALYVSSALAQQLLLVGWLLVRLRTILQDDALNQTGNKRLQISTIAAIIAFLLHAPNLPIMCISLVIGFAFVWVSYATPNLFLAVSCHAILGTLLHRVAGIQVKIGPHYMQKDFHFSRTLFPFLKTIIGDLF